MLTCTDDESEVRHKWMSVDLRFGCPMRRRSVPLRAVHHDGNEVHDEGVEDGISHLGVVSLVWPSGPHRSERVAVDRYPVRMPAWLARVRLLYVGIEDDRHPGLEPGAEFEEARPRVVSGHLRRAQRAQQRLGRADPLWDLVFEPKRYLLHVLKLQIKQP